MNYPEFKKIAISAVEDGMNSVISTCDLTAQDLKQIFQYHLGLDANNRYRGKRIRPLFVLASCHASGGEWKNALPAAFAVEFLHNFSLLHDDIEDKSQMRHGRSSIWKKWGIAQAINAGDGMFSLVYKSIQAGYNLLTPETALLIYDSITECCINLIDGQHLDLSIQGNQSIQVDQYWKMVGGKTAALIGCCFKLGGIIAGVTEEQLSQLQSLGYQIGLNFQVQDDLLGIWGNEEITGKSIDNDLMNRKLTLPVILGLKKSKRFKEWWMKDLREINDIDLIRGWLVEDGVYQNTKDTIHGIETQVDQQLVSMIFIKENRRIFLDSLISELRERKK